MRGASTPTDQPFVIREITDPSAMGLSFRPGDRFAVIEVATGFARCVPTLDAALSFQRTLTESHARPQTPVEVSREW